MNRKLIAALSGGAALLLGLSGCSGNDKEVSDYAKKVCDQVQPQLKKITEASRSITSAPAGGKPSDVKKADSAAFQQISSAYAAMSDAVDHAGVPPVDKGEQVQKDAVKQLDATSKAYADLKKSAEKLDTKDQAAFAEGLRGVADDLGKVSKVGNDAIKKLQSGEIGTAMSQQSGCQRPASAKPGKTSKS